MRLIEEALQIATHYRSRAHVELKRWDEGGLLFLEVEDDGVYDQLP